MMLRSLVNTLKSAVPSLVIACSLTTAACMTDEGDAGEPGSSEVIPGEARAIGQFTVFHWNQSEGQKVLEPKNDYVCVLTKVSGSMKGFGEWVRVSTNNSSWVLEGASQQGFLEAEATCVRRSVFSASQGTDKVVTKQLEVSASGCGQSNTLAAAGNAFTFLEGIQGKFAGSGEFAFTQQSPSINSSNELSANGCQAVRAWGRSMRVGEPVHPATFMSPTGERGDIDSIPEIRIGSNQSIILAPMASALCGLTEIGGAFNGGGESVDIHTVIRDGARMWVLATANGSGSGTFAAARCFAFQQF